MSTSTGVEATPEGDPAAPPGPRELPAGARPVEGVPGYHALIKGSEVTVFGPDGTEIATTRRSYGAATVGRVGDARLASEGIGDGRLTSFAEVAARHHRAAADPDVRDRVWVRWEEDGVYAVYGTDKHGDADRRAVKAGNLYWSGQRQGWATGRKWNPETRDRNLGRVLVAFARQGRNVVVLGPGQEPEDLGGTPGAAAAAAAAAPQIPPAAAEPDPEPEPVYEPEDFSDLSYEDLVTAQAAAATERSQDYNALTSGRYVALQRERGQRLLDRVASAPPVGELSDEELAAESQWWDTAIYKTPWHSSHDNHKAMQQRRAEVTGEQNGRIAHALLSGPAVADLDDAALESAHEQVGQVWSKMHTSHELHEQVVGFRKAAQEERSARRARSYGERTPVGEMALEDLIAEHGDLESILGARNEQSAYNYSEAVKEARGARLRAVETEWDRRGLEQHPEAARAQLGSNIGGRRQVLIDGWHRGYGYVERLGKKFRALSDYDERSRIGDFDSGPAAMAALVQRYDQDPETLPRRTWGTERQVMLPISAHDPLVSWLRRRPGEVSREFARVLEIVGTYELPTQTKVMNPLNSQVMRAYPFSFEEGLLGELARIAERTTQDLREESLNENLPKREREAAKRRIPAMGAALIGINAVIEQVRAAGGDVERRGVDQGRLAAQMAALAGTVDDQEGDEADDDEQPVRDAAAPALGGVPAAGAGADGGPGGVLPDAGDADGRGDRAGAGGAGGDPGAGDGLSGPGGAAPADRGDGAGAGAARDAAAAGGRGEHGGADQPGGGGAGRDPQGAGEPVARFRPDPADLPRGPLARAEANLAAVKVLRELEKARRGATTEEKRVLARWSGWGSVPTVFLDEPDPDEPIYAPGGEWEGRFEADHARWESYSQVRGELRELLDPFEWRAASRAVLSAHYTPQGLAEAMWLGLLGYGFDGGEAAEFGCGSGAFFGVAPQSARLTGVELDPTTAAIAARIYPHANVLAENFTDTDAPTGTFDLIIGNVPFAQAPFGERRYGATGHSLHNGFIIKQLALLRPGAYMAVITSRWTLDSEDPAARRAMARWGDLAAAYRLPAGTFGETADTDVVADVLVFRRRTEGEEPGDQGWIDAPERDLGGYLLAVNAYFTDHPDHVLGRLTSTTGPYGPRVTVQGDPGAAPRLLRERMQASAAAAVAAGRGYVPHEDGADRAPLLLQTARDKHATDFTGRLYVDDQGRIWQHVNGADPVRVVPADGTEGAKQLQALMALRDIASELQELDRSGKDPDRATEVRGQLAGLHASYTAAYGPLSKPRQTRTALPTDEAAAAARDAGVVVADGERLRTGWGWFRQDPNAGVVLGLESWDRANDRPVLSEVLTRRPGARRGDLEPTDDPKTALSAVMGATGRVDLPLIASLLRTTPEQARAALGTEVFDNPVTKKLEHAGAYLSGPVRQKLDQAREAAKTDPAYAVNVAALEAVQPPAKRLGQFTAQLGAHWIPAPLVQGFLREYLGDPTLQVSHNERYGWSLAIGKVPDAVNALKGTERRSAAHIAKALLGRGSLVVNHLDERAGVDEDATRAMRYKADAMRSAFEDYCTATTARVTQLTDAYNRTMNGHVVRSYDGLAPTLEGFTTERTPHPWQLSAAARMQFERGVVLAHEVGLGKTTTMVMGSQALKASGQISKPFAVVQPHLARQWLDEAKLLYPNNAEIHLITSEDLADGNRRRVLEWLRANTPDLVIFTEGAFGSIRMSPEQQELYLFREIESLKEQLERERGVPHNAFALMKLEQRLATVESRIRRNDAPMRTPGEVYWDDLGFDYALIDEAHRFTAIEVRSKEAGGETASLRAVDLHQKLNWHHQMAELAGGRPTATAGTGTPMENSIFEQYKLIEMFCPWLLDQFRVHGPDLWSETFGQKVQRIEMAPDGSGLVIVERYSRFISKSTMKTKWGLATDTKTGDDVGVVRPKLAGGAPELVLVEPTADQKARLLSLVARGQAIHAGDVTRDEDNMLAVSGEGRAVALDPRLVDAGAPAANKLVTAADIIAAGYHAHKDRTYAVSNKVDAPLHPVPGGLFFVFANSGTPGGNNKGGFDAYAELRELLADRGVPREMVQFAQDNATPEKKAAMAEAANHGGIAVLMGSTEVLGTGFNGQNRAYALMHLDQDWTPASMIQRNGRVIRPGNQHEEVNIYFLATKGSMDAWQVGLLTSKAEGLRDIQRPPGVGDDDGDTVEEIGESDWDFATMAAEIGGNPFMRQFMEAKLHLQGLEADRRNAAADRVRQMELLGLKEGELAGTRLAITARDKALPKISDTIRGDAFRIRIGGRDFDQRGEAGPVLRQAVTEAVRAHQTEGLGAWKKLGTFGGLDFAVQPEIVPGSGEIRAHIGFPELRHSESRVSVEDLVKTNIGGTMLGRLATALEKAEDHQFMDRERLPGLEQEIAVLTAQQEAVNYGPAIEHARRRVELLDAVVGAITERDKLPELTESMLDPRKHSTPDSRRKAIQERTEQRAPHQAKVDAAAAELTAFDATNPAPEPVQLVNTFTEDNDTDEAFEQWRERQQIILQQNREAGLGAPLPAAVEPEDVDQATTPPDLGPLNTMSLFEQPQPATAEPTTAVVPPDDGDPEAIDQEAETEQEPDQVPEGQMTMDEVQPEPAAAAPEAEAPEPPEAATPPIVFATPPRSLGDEPESLAQSEQRFGGPERLGEYADRAHLLRTSRVTTTVWLDGRLIGFVSDLEWARGSARDLSWSEEMRRPAGPRFESRPPFGHRDNVSALFVDDRAAVAELVARALQVPVPGEAIDPDTAWTLDAKLGTIRVPTVYPGDDQEGADRLSALREVVANLSAGQLTSADLADDLVLAHDGLLWATGLTNTSGPYMSRAAGELAELLAAIRPQDPRAWRPEPYVPPPAWIEQTAPVQEQLGLFDDAEDVDQEEPATAVSVVEEPPAAVVGPESAAAEPDDDGEFGPDRREDQEQYARTSRVPSGYASLEDWLGDGAEGARAMREDHLQAQVEDAEAAPQVGESMTTSLDQEPEAAPAAPTPPQGPELPPLWTDEAPRGGGSGEPQETAPPPAAPDPGPPQVDLWDGFDQMLQAWADHMPAEQGTADELRTALTDDLQALDRAARPDGDRWDSVVGTAPAPPPESAATPAEGAAAAVSTAIAAADSHADRLRDLPEWQRLQTVRGAAKHLLDTCRKRAGERWKDFWSDARVQGFWRAVSIRTAEAISHLASTIADKLRAGVAADRPAADAMAEVSRAAAAYGTSASGSAAPADPPADGAEIDQPAVPSRQEARPDQPRAATPPATPEAAETARAARKAQPPQPYESREDAVRASHNVAASFRSWIETPMGRELAQSNHPQVVAFREAWHRLPTADLRTGPGPAAGPYGKVAVEARALVEAAVASDRFTRVDVTALRALSAEASTHAGRLAVTLPGTQAGTPAVAAAPPAVATPRAQVPAPASQAAHGPRAGV
ncbi:DEAD/DEAH box helicase family protein [Actinacidiphila acididurans]|uniref:DEAD/DEAH box helicase family protein n=1 Tax=Actinacidiphila acididurans TaxID=2784346 RepID=A0ABS2TVB2_9ACTN|nr:DEAD/DEAH box helicase family protein [Actinacidiphila acididurans]MBM9506752.1 DEAD/DEAH box helicase family protein [Actinacidiphila acididurans]